MEGRRDAQEGRTLWQRDPRDQTISGSPRGSFSIQRIKLLADLKPGTQVTGIIQTPNTAAVGGWEQFNTIPVKVRLQAGSTAVTQGSEVWAFYVPLAGVFEVISSGGGGGGAQLARRYDSPMPARADQDTPGKGNVKFVTYDIPTDAWIEDPQDYEVLSWVNSPSADPADNSPYYYIYLWVERAVDGFLYWTGEDCPPVDPGDPIYQTLEGTTVPANSNTVIVTPTA